MSTTTPGGWQPDPSGLWEYRYWDGTAWTDHVATGFCQSQDPFPAPNQPPADPQYVYAQIDGVSTREPVRLDLTWWTLNFVPLKRVHESRQFPLTFVASLTAEGPNEGLGTLRLLIRGEGYVGPSTFVLSHVANAHWFRAMVLRQRALVTGWPPNG